MAGQTVFLPANASFFNAAGTGAAVEIVSAAANTRGVQVYFLGQYSTNAAAAGDFGLFDLVGGSNAVLMRNFGPSQRSQLAYPVFIPPGYALRFNGSATFVGTAIYTIL